MKHCVLLHRVCGNNPYVYTYTHWLLFGINLKVNVFSSECLIDFSVWKKNVSFVGIMTVVSWWVLESMIQGGIAKMLFHKNQINSVTDQVGKFTCPCGSLNILAWLITTRKVSALHHVLACSQHSSSVLFLDSSFINPSKVLDCLMESE